MDEDSEWYGNQTTAVSDAEFAAQLQRQFDDEDLLTSQMSSSFNFMAPRPSLTNAHSSNQNNHSNLKSDQEIAKRLQRKFYLDMKAQGLSDVDIASMLDSLAPDLQAVDQDLRQAMQASLGIEDPMDQGQSQDSQSFIEKFLLTLYTNCRYEIDTKVAPHPNDDFCVFRKHASNSVKDLTGDLLISPEKVANLMLEKVLINARDWDEFEAAFFILDSISCQMNTSDFNVTNIRLIHHITSIRSISNILLLNTAIPLIGHLNRWLSTNKEAAEMCIRWLLPLPPYETLLLSISKTLEEMASLMYMDIAHCFKPILDFLPYVELTTDHGIEMEEAALNLIKCCTHLINDKPSDQLIAGLEALLNRPTHALNELSSGNFLNDESSSDGSWQKIASSPRLWINRIIQIFKNLFNWQSQKEYLDTKFGDEYPNAPWSNLTQTVCQVICHTISAFANDQSIVEDCCQACIQIVNTDLSGGSSPIIIQVLNELLSVYQRQPQTYILQLSEKFIGEYTIGLDVESPISSFLNAISIHTFDEFLNIDQLRDHSELIRGLFVIVNSFTRLRITSFAEQPAAQILFEAAIPCLSIEENGLHKYAKAFILMFLQFPRNQTSSELDSILQNIELMMASCTEKILEHCLRIALYETSVQLINTSAEVLSEILLFESQKVDEFLGPCIQRLITSDSVSMEEIHSFESQLKRSLNSEDVLNTMIWFSRSIRR